MARLRINPDIACVWTSPTTLRFGIDQAVVVLTDPPAKIERLIAALRDGMPDERYPHIAAAFGVSVVERAQLLDALAPVLLPDESAVTNVQRSLRIHLDEARGVPTGLSALITSECHTLSSADEAELVILTAQFSCTAERARPWLNQGVRHLPIVFGENSVSIGPLVGVGNNPCAFCLELSRVDAEPAWPAIASQCLGKRANTNEPAMLSITAGVVMQLLRRWQFGEDELFNNRIRLRAHPTQLVAVTHEEVWPHPRCDCQRFVA